MGYTLRICRPNESIPMEDWKNAVAEIQGIKIDNSDSIAISPNGSKIVIPGNEGDVSMVSSTGGFLGIGKKEEWEKVISFYEGEGIFNYINELESPQSPIRQAIKKLTDRLNAKIIGDEGEEYNW